VTELENKIPVLSLFTGAGLLDRGFEQEGFSVTSAGDILWGRDVRESMKYRLVGNGCPVPMARVIAAAVSRRAVTEWTRLCVCDCGRPVRAGQTMATPACRKRMQRARDAAGVTKPGSVTPAMSPLL
jgi:hypothetical protein